MPTGYYQRKPRVERVCIECIVCGNEFSLLPGQFKVRPNVKYCSRSCMGKGSAKPDTMVDKCCAQCGKSFRKRHDLVKDKNYCSRQCVFDSRKVEGAKWRDESQIKEYMKNYTSRNRATLTAQSKQWAENNREKRKEVQAKYRQENKEAIRVYDNFRRSKCRGVNFNKKDWVSLVEFYGNKCLRCGVGFELSPMTLDHINPISLGGLHLLSNVQPLCKPCNSAKNARNINYRPQSAWPAS